MSMIQGKKWKHRLQALSSAVLLYFSPAIIQGKTIPAPEPTLPNTTQNVPLDNLIALKDTGNTLKNLPILCWESVYESVLLPLVQTLTLEKIGFPDHSYSRKGSTIGKTVLPGLLAQSNVIHKSLNQGDAVTERSRGDRVGYKTGKNAVKILPTAASGKKKQQMLHQAMKNYWIRSARLLIRRKYFFIFNTGKFILLIAPEYAVYKGMITSPTSSFYHESASGKKLPELYLSGIWINATAWRGLSFGYSIDTAKPGPPYGRSGILGHFNKGVLHAVHRPADCGIGYTILAADYCTDDFDQLADGRTRKAEFTGINFTNRYLAQKGSVHAGNATPGERRSALRGRGASLHSEFQHPDHA